MIKIVKGVKPDLLEDQADIWRDELLALIAVENEDPTTYQKGKYNRPEVKAAVIAETYGKCAYCESKILHIDFGDIEHILPKKERPELWFEWENLTLACSVCNNKKRAYYDEELPLLDPYDDEPEQRLLFFGPLVRAAPGDDSAFKTERVLDLNRPKLIERRTERLDQLLMLASLVENAAPGIKEVLEDDFLSETENEREYSSLARTIARNLGLTPPPP